MSQSDIRAAAVGVAEGQRMRLIWIHWGRADGDFLFFLRRGEGLCCSASCVTGYLNAKEADVDYFRTFFLWSRPVRFTSAPTWWSRPQTAGKLLKWISRPASVAVCLCMLGESMHITRRARLFFICSDRTRSQISLQPRRLPSLSSSLRTCVRAYEVRDQIGESILPPHGREREREN